MRAPSRVAGVAHDGSHAPVHARPLPAVPDVAAPDEFVLMYTRLAQPDIDGIIAVTSRPPWRQLVDKRGPADYLCSASRPTRSQKRCPYFASFRALEMAFSISGSAG